MRGAVLASAAAAQGCAAARLDCMRDSSCPTAHSRCAGCCCLQNGKCSCCSHGAGWRACRLRPRARCMCIRVIAYRGVVPSMAAAIASSVLPQQGSMAVGTSNAPPCTAHCCGRAFVCDCRLRRRRSLLPPTPAAACVHVSANSAPRLLCPWRAATPRQLQQRGQPPPCTCCGHTHVGQAAAARACARVQAHVCLCVQQQAACEFEEQQD